MQLSKILGMMCVTALLIAGWAHSALAQGPAPEIPQPSAPTPDVTVGSQYHSSHVLVAPKDLDRFVASILATFGGTAAAKITATTVTPTPSSTILQIVFTPAGTFSVFGFTTPVPYPFGEERTGDLVTDVDAATKAALSDGADILVTPFNDPIGRDVIVRWPGGMNMQLYWHKTPPSYKPLQTIPEGRVYESPDRADWFVRAMVAFTHGKLVSDDAHAPGIEIGRPAITVRRIRIESKFGKLAAFVTDGQLPFPYGWETTGYEVANLADTLAKAKAAGVTILVAPYKSDQREAAFVQFPGGYIAEIHSPISK